MMSVDKKYRIVFLGLVETPEGFKENMSRFGVNGAVVDQILQKAPVILKGDMTLGDARKYADAVHFAGGRVNIQESGLFEETKIRQGSMDIKSLEKFTMCPECGYKQLKKKFCERCGSHLGREKAEGN